MTNPPNGTNNATSGSTSLVGFLLGAKVRIIACVLVLGIGMLAWRFILPRSYTTEATLYFPPSIGSGLAGLAGGGGDTPPIPVFDGLYSIPRPGATPDNAKILLRTNDLLGKLVDKLELRKAYGGSRKDVIESLQKWIKVKAGESGDLEVKFTDIDAKRTHAVVETAIKLLEEKANALSMDPTERSLTFVESELKSAEARFAKHLNAVQRFLEQNNGVPPQAKLDQMGQIYFTLQQDLTKARIQQNTLVVTADNLTRAATEMVKGAMDPNVGAGTAPSLLNELYQKEVSLKAQLIVLQKAYGDKVPDVVAAKRNLEVTQKQLREEIDRMLTNLKKGENPYLAREVVQVLAGQANVAGLEKAGEQVKSMMTAVPTQATRYAMLQLDLETEKAKVTLLRTEFAKTKLVKDARPPKFVLADPPTVPEEPDGRRALLFAFVGATFGFILGAYPAVMAWYRTQAQNS